MPYYDKSGGRVRPPRLRRSEPEVRGVSEADARFILQVAAENPKFTADEVYAEICHGRRRKDITKQTVRKVLAERP